LLNNVIKGFILKLIKKAIVIGVLILVQGCVSYDLVHVETYSSGQKPVKGTAVKQVKYGDGFKWVGVIISPIIPIPLILPYGRERTTTWLSDDGASVYTEIQKTEANGYGCMFISSEINGCSDETTWGALMINDIKLH
tara:strand:+ start:6097 stop:6510 length:414 start_codon:yes stop_codon:yes gene_type:complete